MDEASRVSDSLSPGAAGSRPPSRCALRAKVHEGTSLVNQKRRYPAIHARTGRTPVFAAFVDAEGERAIEVLSGKELNGQALTVNEARPKTDRQRLSWQRQQ
jgi:hypothetical protein